MRWNDICNLDEILPNGAVCSLLEGEQIAIFRIQQAGEDKLFAISNFDPFSKANVISRGVVGSIGERLVVASPVYKEHFDLSNGQCIENETVQLETWPIQLNGNKVQVLSKKTETA